MNLIAKWHAAQIDEIKKNYTLLSHNWKRVLKYIIQIITIELWSDYIFFSPLSYLLLTHIRIFVSNLCISKNFRHEIIRYFICFRLCLCCLWYCRFKWDVLLKIPMFNALCPSFLIDRDEKRWMYATEIFQYCHISV